MIAEFGYFSNQFLRVDGGFGRRPGITGPRPDQFAAVDLLHRMRQPAGGTGKREHDDRRLPRQIEGSGHRGKHEIDVDLLTDHVLASFPDFGKRLRQEKVRKQRLSPDIAIRIERMAKGRQAIALGKRAANRLLRSNS